MRIIRKVVRRLAFWFILAFLLGLTPHTRSQAAEPLNVYVVNYPLQYFAERIGGEHVTVTFPAPADVDPAYWIPDITTIGAYQQADLILLNGATFAKWVGKVSLPRSRVINTSKQFSDRYITTAGAVTHSHGPGGKHGHEALAFTTWLDFTLAAQQAEVVAAALGRKLPQQRRTFAQNLAKLKSDLLALDSEMRDIVDRESFRPLVASHPVYDYLARAYGMNIQSVHWEPNELPGDAQWSDLLDTLKTHPSRWMVWEAKPMQGSTQRLRSVQLNSLVFDPCGNTPESGDFISVMRENMDQLKQAYD